MTQIQITKKDKAELAKIFSGSKKKELPRILQKLVEVLTKDQAHDSELIIDQETEEVVTPNEAANLLNVSRPFLMKLVKEGKLGTFMVGTHHRLKRKEVLEFKKVLEKWHKENFSKLSKSLNNLINEEGWDD